MQMRGRRDQELLARAERRRPAHCHLSIVGITNEDQICKISDDCQAVASPPAKVHCWHVECGRDA
jgi:hypothetical protein